MEDRFVVERAAEYSISPQYRPTVVESHLSKYVLEVDPLAFDKDRASFSYRSPGLGVIQNSTVEIAFDLRLTSRVPITYVGQMGPQIQILQNNATQELAGQAANAAFDVRSLQGTAAIPSSKLAFGSGDAMQKCISSMQIVVNGAAIAQTRQRDYMRSLQKCWFDKDVFQKRFAQCGGTPQQYDAVAVSGETLQNIVGHQPGGLAASVAPYTGVQDTLTVAGFTGDSGIRDRLKNVLGCIQKAPVGTATTAVRDIRVRWRINGTGLFNPLSRGDKVASSCPYRQSARALPHMNVVSINILFQDLMKTLIRNFSTAISVAGTIGAQDFAEGGDNSVVVDFPPDGPKAKLYVEYLRLPSWRAQSGTALLQTYRVAIHDPTSQVTEDVATVPVTAVDGAAVASCLKPSGIDRYAGNAAQWRQTAVGIADQKPSFRECSWNGITAAQIPQYLFVVMEKSTDMFCNSTRFVTNAQIINFAGGGANIVNQESFAVDDVGEDATTGSGNASRKCQLLARNSDGNAAITQFHLEIMSVQGSYIYSSGDWPWLKTRGDLYRDVQKYCIDSYDDQDTWFKHNCIVLLGAAEFAKGISSPGCAFPVTFSVKARFENWRQFVDGHGCAYLIGNGLGAAQDIIAGRPVLGMIYPQQSLQISASSALLSSQNISHSSGMELLSRQ